MRICTPQDDGSVRHLFDAPDFIGLASLMRTAAAGGFGVYLAAWRLEIDGQPAVYLFRDIDHRRAFYAANRGLAWRGGFETNRAA